MELSDKVRYILEMRLEAFVEAYHKSISDGFKVTHPEMVRLLADINEIEFNLGRTNSIKTFNTPYSPYNKAIDDVITLLENHEEEIYVGVFDDIKKLKK